MVDLAAIFKGEVVRAGQSAPPCVDDAELTARLAGLCKRGRAAFPSLSVGDEALVRHLAGCGPRLVPPSPSLADLVIEDLHLVFACLTAAPGPGAALHA